ncbi:uncharacterized protein LOC113770546 isoform X1 [Coffea eugenioides]|uniref:uncharacterized protein LOC113770546 isoform X1 n=1 Tax=Coffea eugenioides TaxID=49369 RepID=UPI000F606B66|nr:uncharacterized protein LOC113770546 isoform X1 [Coffea eugenioides]XP_027170831.1 uncharacterized protein LOC113770546 isoform X1 [Coffea eugenioides]XP_027170832.1 uncharacterized protein LOC113770546 isoform X1 [Coffea eugenioides]XP_027170833.1 uncharacterized protein LOC113770546 isoform X1 [Coffea eugenioides]XP_027170835.1 uncharacterized protein LOC113770546 isoform X1 [Coffea eugenioides]
MMDLKGLAWIGNIYDKFEAMCLEMEEVMYEDAVKYVENQVQTVGASVKRFYSEVMKDLHSDSYVDPVKVAAADLSLNPYAHSKMILKANAKKDGRDTNWKLSDESKVISGKRKTGLYRRPVASRKSNSMVNFMPPVTGPVAPFSENLRNLSSFSQMKKSCQMASGCVDVLSPPAGAEERSRIANEKLCKPMDDTSLPMSRASFNSPATAAKTIVSVVSAEQKQADSPSDGLSSESSAVGTCTNSRVVSQTQKTIATGTGSTKSVEEEVFMAHQERLDDYIINAAKNDDTVDPDVEIIEPFDESKLGETCVLVEGDELHFLPQGKGNHKSYKKKLREAFSSKMRLKKKEYEQLAARYTEQNSNQEGAERAMTDRPAESNTKSFPVHSSETEWELV